MRSSGFYAKVNDETFDNKEDYDNYMKSQYYIDNRSILRDNCYQVIEELERSLIEKVELFDKYIELNITIDKSGYLIKTYKEKENYEEEL